ncbi:hypothetical protein [Rhodococcus sp. 14-2470-1a]|uniref:hypothetical protein n=1 Tax=Rhodococcus sp. 14-2470-1a TaxID=2023150 RepID=UPI000B9BA697|nr:hypothetical protein [Rhodococcus sp. 14-2470-1a]OZF52507.1 hypothetical protein CH292_10240 [Rhodococcus sp. 14-2470-1a]
MEQKPSFVWLWRESLVVSAVATYGVCEGTAIVVLWVLAAMNGVFSPETAGAAAALVLVWGTWYFVMVGWILILVVSLLVAWVRYVVAVRRYRRWTLREKPSRA